MAPVDPSGFDSRRLAAWMDLRGLGEGPITEVQIVTGGTQNLLVSFCRSGERYVLRRPPVGTTASNAIIQRESLVLAALQGTRVPHPRLIMACDDPMVLGAAFYLMESVEGFNPAGEWPEPHRSDLHLQRDVGLSMAAAIGEIATLNVAEVGLGSFGRPDGWLERQVPRWKSQLDSYRKFTDYRPSLRDVERIGRWLEANRPVTWATGLIHGDYHFSNVIVSPHSGSVAAVVDWELSTVGDPLLDLGHMLTRWPGPYAMRPLTFAATGLPTMAEVVDVYSAVSGSSLEHLAWYRVLACYRLAVILEGTFARSRAGLAPLATGERLHASAVRLLEQGASLVDGAAPC